MRAFQTVITFLTATSYYSTGTLSDVAIACDGQEFNVHGVILSAHSRYFAVELTGNWKVLYSTVIHKMKHPLMAFKESSEKKIEIKDFDAAVVDAMLRFMYSFDYTNTCGSSTMIHDAQVYQIADKYNIPALKAHAKEKFGSSITAGWSLDDYPHAPPWYMSPLPQRTSRFGRGDLP